MIQLSSGTLDRVNALFGPDDAPEAMELLERDCADNLPGLENDTPVTLERIRFAALKVSGGDLEKLVDAISLAQLDFRDLLMSAGFGYDVEAHLSWFP